MLMDLIYQGKPVKLPNKNIFSELIFKINDLLKIDRKIGLLRLFQAIVTKKDAAN